MSVARTPSTAGHAWSSVAQPLTYALLASAPSCSLGCMCSRCIAGGGSRTHHASLGLARVAPAVLSQPRPITPIPTTFQGVEQGLQRWKDRLPEAFSSPSRQSYSNWVTGASQVLAAGQLQELDLRAIRQQVKSSKTKRARGRLQCGGELRASEAHELQKQKAELQAQKLAAAEARKLSQAANRAQKLVTAEARKLSQAAKRAQKQLRRAGIEARKQERLRKKSVAQLTQSGFPIPPELQDPITDPEADSGSEYESASEGGRGSGRWSGRWSGSESGNEEVIIS
ncbi:hypothetical protein VC83_08094 [Pseudogymnoascus destructans]|uniref:Uncharacterized protein n=2 Tax=Pseudogymnoascus destructans TaxID=655981 RepID=L8FX40_PSED2|nr:uncharacterized protein VC83_08094 [Pseudogymnoascus destructans]ELR04286.1 hypothetical protein GMDG_06682 [Pseudogymnoascus destructans 20631-21]OAF55888.1 hypothetical protein VC83_08094 [Pseudogymnoascus destructans]